ncbi:hypothetical protein BKA61DRAFT_673563 [Leptodontidium sp. MPI-SDFR-AT-0119]|nr:hypothetical protein BKA61DRAFT_673563 [Leptodontidium sp. MPI-SDFR-AT-0119]
MPTGSCLYGAITYEYTGEPIQTARYRAVLSYVLIGIGENIDCGSSLYVQPDYMKAVTVIKAETLDSESGNIIITTERYTKSRRDFATPILGAIQAESM